VIEGLIGLAGTAALVLGLVLATIGLYGMLRKPSIFEQLHAAGLVTGPGAILVLVASLASGRAEIATSAVLVIAFILVTSSLSTHAIALTAWRMRYTVPPARGREAWNAAPDGSRTTALRALLAHDGSPGADIATTLAASLEWPGGSVVRVIGVADGDVRPFADPVAPPDAAADVRASLGPAVASVARALQRDGLMVDSVVRQGDPASTIADEARAFGADLVVIGSRDLGAVRTLFSGSVAAATIDAAPCSVLVARTPAVARLVLGADGTDDSDAAVDAVARWPIFRDVVVDVLSVAMDLPATGSPTAEGGMAATAARSRRQRLADGVATRLATAGLRATAHVRDGDAASQIVGFAGTRGADLIVLGTRQRTGLTRALLGSVGRTVVSTAGVSVLIVKAGPRA
jgi:monovalent cation/proton antiporter MnhG/PhaG subunit